MGCIWFLLRKLSVPKGLLWKHKQEKLWFSIVNHTPNRKDQGLVILLLSERTVAIIFICVAVNSSWRRNMPQSWLPCLELSRTKSYWGKGCGLLKRMCVWASPVYSQSLLGRTVGFSGQQIHPSKHISKLTRNRGKHWWLRHILCC